MSRCDICGEKDDTIPVIRTTSLISVGEGEDREEYHQILICHSCIIKLYRKYCIEPKNQKIDGKK